MRSGTRNELRKAASGLANAVRERKYESVVFASASRGEGTTTMVLHIARLLKERERIRPLVVELNRARPVYAKLFGLAGCGGISDIERGKSSARECVQQGPSGVGLIPMGKPDAAGEVTSDVASVVRNIILELSPDYDLVMIDAPPLLEDPDGQAALRATPHLVLVVRAAHTSYERLQRMERELRQTVPNFSLEGTVLNRFRRYIPGWIHAWLLR